MSLPSPSPSSTVAVTGASAGIEAATACGLPGSKSSVFASATAARAVALLSRSPLQLGE